MPLSNWSRATMTMDDQALEYLAQYIERCLQQWGRRPTIQEMRKELTVVLHLRTT